MGCPHLLLPVLVPAHVVTLTLSQLVAPATAAGARRWSPLAKWRLREFNELPHFISHR